MEEQKVTEIKQEAQYKVETKGISKKTFAIVLGGLLLLILLILSIVLVVLNQNNQNVTKKNVSSVSSVMSSEETSNETTTSEVTSTSESTTSSTNKSAYTYRTNEGKYIRFKYPEGWNINVQVETEGTGYFSKGIKSVEISSGKYKMKADVMAGMGVDIIYRLKSDSKVVEKVQLPYEEGQEEEIVKLNFSESPKVYKLVGNNYLFVPSKPLTDEGSLKGESLIITTKRTTYYETVGNYYSFTNPDFKNVYILDGIKNVFLNGVDTNSISLSFSGFDGSNPEDVKKFIELSTTFLGSLEKKANVE